MKHVDLLYPRTQVTLREVGLRDGLQLVARYPDTSDKMTWVRDEYQAGVRVFEVGSFLPPGQFPQFADVREMIAAVKTLDGGRAAALTLNERGARDALETDVDEMMFVISATEAHNQANTHRSRAQALELLAKIVGMRDAAGTRRPIINVAISMALGCSMEGEVAPAEVLRLVEGCLRAGADVITLADTVGYAGPTEVARLVVAVQCLTGDAVPLAGHFHDTRGMAIANAAAALDAGVRILDGSLGGLGGCPFAPGATGNVVFEDLAFLCESMGLETGMDIDGLVAARATLMRSMPGETLYGALARAGLPKTARWHASPAANP